MTEQEKVALVERCKTIASWREKYGDDANVMLPAMEAEQIASIALAALTAEPEVVYQLWSPGIGQWVECDKVRFDEHSILPAQRRKLFTTPPAPARQWIKCSERMPEKETLVLVCFAGSDVSSLWWNGQEWDDGYDEAPIRQDVTHWMPLPAAWQPGGDNG